MNTPRFIVTLSFASLIAAPLWAADGKAYQSFHSNAPKQSEELVEDLGPVAAPSGMPGVKFRANVGGQVDYTSNARLSGNHGSGDFLYLPSLEVGLNVPLRRGFSFDLGIKAQTVFYTRFDERAFATYSAVGTFDWRPKPNLPRIYVSVEPYRFDSFDTGELITQAIGLSAGTDWGFSFNRGKSLAFAGYSFSHYYSDPHIDTRSTHRGVVGVTHSFQHQLFGQLYYAYQYSDFDEISRQDHRNIAGMSLTYQLNRHLFSTLSGNFVDNDSTQDRASYQSAGGSIGMTWQF